MTAPLILPPLDVLATAAAELAETARQAEDYAAERAFNKATFHLHQHITITPTVGGMLVPSGTRGGVIHRISNAYGCSCEAGVNGVMCWHAALIELVILAQARALPTKPRVRITREQIDAGRAARLAHRIVTARKTRAELEMDECFA